MQRRREYIAPALVKTGCGFVKYKITGFAGHNCRKSKPLFFTSAQRICSAFYDVFEFKFTEKLAGFLFRLLLWHTAQLKGKRYFLKGTGREDLPRGLLKQVADLPADFAEGPTRYILPAIQNAPGIRPEYPGGQLAEGGFSAAVFP